MSDNPYSSPATNPTNAAPSGGVQIRRIGVLQLGKLMGVMYFLITAVIIVPVMLVMMMAGGGNAGPAGALGLLIAPVIYAVAGFLGGILCAFVYNIVAGWVGGVEIELQR